MRRMHKPAAVFRHATTFFAAVTMFTGAALVVGALLSHLALLAVEAANPAEKQAAKQPVPKVSLPVSKAATNSNLVAPASKGTVSKGTVGLVAGGNAVNGQKLFRQNNCSMCHPGGENNLNPLKPLRGPGFLKKYPNDDLICQQVRKGSVGLGMPAFPKSQITDGELRDIIAYIRSLTPPTAVPYPTKKAQKKPA